MRALLRDVVDGTFNRISVDGDMSTNDTVLWMANGRAANKSFTRKSAAGRQVERQLFAICEHIARMMIRDGEGATKCVRLEVHGARTEADARRVAYTVANSQLCRTSFYGQDPNWGRLLAAIARSGAKIRPETIDIRYGRVTVCRRGQTTGAASDKKAQHVMRAPEFTVTIHLHQGRASFFLYTSDLTHQYVTINSAYRT